MRKVMLLVAFAAAVANVVPLTCVAQSPRQVKASELKRTPFSVGGLNLTLRKLDGYVHVSADERDVGVGYAAVRIENGTDQFVTFSPVRLVVVGKDGKQASVGYERRSDDRVTAGEIRLAPGAHAEAQYNLTGRVRFPAKVYYGDELLAVVTD